MNHQAAVKLVKDFRRAVYDRAVLACHGKAATPAFGDVCHEEDIATKALLDALEGDNGQD